MATEVGFISALIGTATATATDGTVRTLQVGDKVYPNEIITTGLAGAVEVEFLDGSLMDLGRNSQAVLDNETFDFDNATPPAATADSDVFDDIEAIQQALLDGADPTEIADPTAAGPGAQPSSEGGSDAVVVDYLAPRVTPQAGFDTTGPGVSFPDPPPFQFLVDGSDDLFLTPGELPPGPETPNPPGEDPLDPETPNPPGEDPLDPETPTPPNAPTLLVSVGGEIAPSNFIVNGSFEDRRGVNAAGEEVDRSPSLGSSGFSKMLSITGWDLVDGTITPMEPHAGGHGGVGSTDGKHFMDLGASPGDIAIYQNVSGLIDGQQYKLSFDFINKAIVMAKNAASGKMQVEWNGTIIATIGGEGSLITLYGADGQPSDELADLSEWQSIAITINAQNNEQGVNELVFREIASQPGEDGKPTIRLDEHGIAIDNVKLESDFFQYDLSITAELPGEGSDGLIVRLPTDSLPSGVSIAGYEPGSDGFYQINIDSSGKATLSLISETKLTEAEVNEISGSVTAPSGGSFDTTAYWEITGGVDDDLLAGTAGNDLLTGGAGKDIFAWNAGDEGTAAVPARDIVTDFNATEGDVLDFSDILVGEESGDLTDFISITEDGADIVIELKPDANDVTQVITLQGTSLADFGMGGYDVATQQADIINKLVQDGHVNVDS